MARCGCNTAMSTTCDAIMVCVSANLGRGLDYNETTGQIDLRLSTDTGNIAQEGTEGGFYAPASPGPDPMAWPKTVATLPAQPMTAADGSGLVLPATSPWAIEYTIANGIDIYATSAYALADGVALEHLDNRDNSITTYLDNPGAITWGQLGSTNLPSLLYDAGTRVSPTARSAPSQFTQPDGGWAGFYADPFAPRTISHLLRIVRGRAVVAVFVRFEGLTQAEDDQALASVAAVVQAVVDAGAQEWVIIMPQDNYEDGTRTPLAAMMALITGAGITGGVNLFSDENVAVPWTAAEIVATGATWLDIAGPSYPTGADAARISEFIAAGLQVMVYTDSRQYWTDWAFDLGARTVRARDAVYARGGRGQPGDLDYRQTFIPGLETRTAVTGGITPINNVAPAVFDQGFARSDLPGRWFPLGYGWDGTLPVIRNAQLLGTICPVPNPTDYVIKLRVRREVFTGTNEREVGIFFAVPTDLGVSHQNVTGIPNPNADGYAAWLSSKTSGSPMSLQRITNGLLSPLASGGTSSVALVADTWITLSITVRPTGITFAVTSGATTNTVTSTDTTWRGAYAYYLWDDQLGQMVHGYGNPTDMVMYEPLS